MNMLKNILPLALLALLAACNLTKEVEIELPEYERQPVVECYLEPGKPLRLLLTQSFGYFDPFGLDSTFLQKTLLDSALVTIAYDGRVDTLKNQLAFDFSPFKIYNYVSPNLTPATPGIEYRLQILLKNGQEITGETTMMPFVPIDSIRVEFSPDLDTLARILTFISDPEPGRENYFRRLLNYAALDSVPDQDFLTSDRIAQTPLIAFGTGYELAEGDTVYNTVLHIEKAYYDYVESVQLAVFGNLNPFAQPSPIKSNVRGSANPIGIFTGLMYDRKMTIVKK
jgi:hypothetical protein